MGLDEFINDENDKNETSSSCENEEKEDEQFKCFPPKTWSRTTEDNDITWKEVNQRVHKQEEWKYVKCVEVLCSCGNNFTFVSKGMCMNCGTKYLETETEVKKVR